MALNITYDRLYGLFWRYRIILWVFRSQKMIQKMTNLFLYSSFISNGKTAGASEKIIIHYAIRSCNGRTIVQWLLLRTKEEMIRAHQCKDSETLATKAVYLHHIRNLQSLLGKISNTAQDIMTIMMINNFLDSTLRPFLDHC